jgi:hypothetical protein
MPTVAQRAFRPSCVLPISEPSATTGNGNNAWKKQLGFDHNTSLVGSTVCVQEDTPQPDLYFLAVRVEFLRIHDNHLPVDLPNSPALFSPASHCTDEQLFTSVPPV